MDGIEYDGSTLLFAMTEEGRVRPGANGTYIYDYFLKDHLGNIRVVLTSEAPTLNTYPPATMEEGSATSESLYYANLDATREAKPGGFDSNVGNVKVARLTASEATRQTGPSITLKVNVGDKLNLSVKSFYKSSGADYSRNALGATALSQLLNALLNPMSLSGSSQSVASDMLNTSTFGTGSTYQNMIGSLPGSSYNSPPANTPKAYLVWLLFDNEFNLIKTGNSSGMLQVPTGADQLKTLAQADLSMDKSGFFYAYVYNESLMNVYFDDFQVSTTAGQVLEQNDYYPFGMLNAQLSAPGITDPINKYKYNGKELQKELNLEWLDYGARFYDPVIGRWNSVDPMTEKDRRWSPYTYGVDNPMRFIDPDGMNPTPPDIYVDYTGHQVGDDHQGNNIRLIASKEAYQHYENEGIQELRNNSKVITVQSVDAQKRELSQLHSDAVTNRIEPKAYAVLDTKNATLSFERQPQLPDDDAHTSVNQATSHDRGNTSFISPRENAGDKVIVGQAHGHDDITVSPPGAKVHVPGISTADKNLANGYHIPVYAVESYTVFKITQYGSRTSISRMFSFDYLRDALNMYNKKP